jgi:hypothetical protein
MSSRFASFLSASVLSLAATAALAQGAPPAPAQSTTVAPLTVQAAPPPKVVEQQSRSFVQSYAAAPNTEVNQIGRWREAVCAMAIGLPADQAASVKARIEDVAGAVGLHKASPKCLANVEVVFSDKPQAVMDQVAKRQEYLLGYYHRHEHDRLKTVTHPIQAWYVTATQGGGGNLAGIMFSYGDPIPGANQVHREVTDDPDNATPASCGDNPHFTGCLQTAFKNVFVVVDTSALKGKDLGLITDYLVMLALSQPKSLDGCNGLPSVIDLLAKTACPGRDTPDGLTPGDAAYLTALYESDLQARKGSEQGEIAERMAKILTKASAGR